MKNDREFWAAISNADQTEAAIKGFAETLFAYHAAMLEAGFNRAMADTLTVNYHQTFWIVQFNKNAGKGGGD